MTCKEKLEIDHPEMATSSIIGGYIGCPHHYGYFEDNKGCDEITCEECWSREIPGTEEKSDDM